LKVCTAAQMRSIDLRTIETFGIPGMVLMERAGLAVASAITEGSSPLPQEACIVCGTGNNGGDGFVIARELARKEVRVRVFLIGSPDRMKKDARRNYDILAHLGIPVKRVSSRGHLSLPAQGSSSIVVDALFGTGLQREVTDLPADIIRKINASSLRVLSVDIPSGISSDTGQVMGEAVRAAQTVTFGLPKVGHVLYPGTIYAGHLTVTDIGFPPQAVEMEDIRLETLDTEDIAGILPGRPVDGHKGTFGHLLVLAGSRGKVGAALLAGLAALRTGCGLVTLALPESLALEATRKFPEVMTLPLPETSEGTLSRKALPDILRYSKKTSAVAVGPGLSVNADIMILVREVLSKVRKPTVADADAINALMGDAAFLKGIKRRIAITPHPAEFGRLMDCETVMVQADRLGAVRSFTDRYHHVLALKGAHTLVGGPEGRICINLTGNSGMGTAGSGDVLTGMTGALLAGGLAPFDAARAAVHLHGLAGDLAAAAKDERSLIARDIIDRIPEAFGSASRIAARV